MSTPYKPYFEKLKDPRWQRKRLEIMQSANFECSNCGDKTETLNVHHLLYSKGIEPWDYPDMFLKCFCQPCHERWHLERESLLCSIAQIESEGVGMDALEWFLMWKKDKNQDAFYALLSDLISDKKRHDQELSNISKEALK